MRVILLIVFAIILSACQMNDEGRKDSNKQFQTERIHHDPEQTNDENRDVKDSPMKQYLQSDEKGIGKGGTQRKLFQSDESLKITQILSERDDVKQAQVATTDNEVAAFVLLRDYQNPDIAESLEADVEKIAPQKDIFIYTDKTHWNRLKDLDSSIRARDIGNDLEKFLEEHLNIEIKD